MKIVEKIDVSGLKPNEGFERNLFEFTPALDLSGIWGHTKMAEKIRDKNPYTITVIVDLLRFGLGNKKEFVRKTKRIINSKYMELLYKSLFDEFGDKRGNEVYAEWLKKYNRKDDQIVAAELEPRYKEGILSRFRNKGKLFGERVIIEKERIYNVPGLQGDFDWRSPYDNLFVWEEGGKKVYARGGSGSSGRREINSMFIYGFLTINKKFPVTSYLFIYSENNELVFVKKFERLTVPDYDIGSNYHLEHEESEKLMKAGRFLRWNSFGKVSAIEVMEYRP